MRRQRPVIPAWRVARTAKHAKRAERASRRFGLCLRKFISFPTHSGPKEIFSSTTICPLLIWRRLYFLNQFFDRFALDLPDKILRFLPVDVIRMNFQ